MDTIWWLLIVAVPLVIAIFEAKFILRVLKKVETYEEWISMIKFRTDAAYKAIRSADIRGSFEADDEVGTAFRSIKATVEDLKTYSE